MNFRSAALIAKNVFNSGASGYAFLTASMGIGATIGGLYFASKKRGAPYKLASAASFWIGYSGSSLHAQPDIFRNGDGHRRFLLDQLFFTRETQHCSLKVFRK